MADEWHELEAGELPRLQLEKLAWADRSPFGL